MLDKKIATVFLLCNDFSLLVLNAIMLILAIIWWFSHISGHGRGPSTPTQLAKTLCGNSNSRSFSDF